MPAIKPLARKPKRALYSSQATIYRGRPIMRIAISGLQGVGKSVTAHRLADNLYDRNFSVIVLDGDGEERYIPASIKGACQGLVEITVRVSGKRS